MHFSAYTVYAQNPVLTWVARSNCSRHGGVHVETTLTHQPAPAICASHGIIATELSCDGGQALELGGARGACGGCVNLQGHVRFCRIA